MEEGVSNEEDKEEERQQGCKAVLLSYTPCAAAADLCRAEDSDVMEGASKKEEKLQ